VKELKIGQNHNANAKKTYDDCSAQSNLESFMTLVLGASDAACDLSLAEANISWQRDNNRSSLDHAKTRWGKNESAREGAGGMYHLLQGQRHNPSVMKLYRACFRDKRAELYALVRKYAG